MSLKAKLEAIIYAAEEPVTIEQIVSVLADEISADLGSQSSEAPPSADAIESNEHQPEPHLVLTDAKQEAKQRRQRSQRRVREVLEELIKEYDLPEHGMEIRQVAGGYRMSTKPEHHDAVRQFVKNLKPPMKLSLPEVNVVGVPLIVTMTVHHSMVLLTTRVGCPPPSPSCTMSPGVTWTARSPI